MKIIKRDRPWTFYIRRVMADAHPACLTAAQIAEAVNKLLNIPAGDHARLTHGNCESALNRMSDVSRTSKSTEPNETGEHPQGWRLRPSTLMERERAETRRLTRQISLAANKLPFSQRIAALKKCLATVSGHAVGE
jgi:hypothetical protein